MKFSINNIKNQTTGRWICCVFGVAFSIIFAYIANMFLDYPEDIYKYYILNGGGGTCELTLEPERIILFKEFGAYDFTCTGFTYDNNENVYWICDCGLIDGKTYVPRIIKVDSYFTKILDEIYIQGIVKDGVNAQGLAYDDKDNTLWLALGNSVIEINKDGKVLNSFKMYGDRYCKANGLCYSKKSDTLWILTTKTLLHVAKDGTVLERQRFFFKDQDHLCILNEDELCVTIGADYSGKDNFVAKIRVSDGAIVELYRVGGAYSLEGICVNDEQIMIVNDGFYHSDLIGCDYISIYDFKKSE